MSLQSGQLHTRCRWFMIAKIPIPVARLSARSSAMSNELAEFERSLEDLSRSATGYFGIFAEILCISAPHFHNKKDLISKFEFIYRCLLQPLQSSGEFKFKVRFDIV